MLLNEIKNINQPDIDAKMIVETLDAVLMLELWGGVSAMAGAAKDKIKQAGQSVANTYNQGEIQSLVKQYEAYKAKLMALIQKYPHAFGVSAQSGQNDSAQVSPKDAWRRKEINRSRTTHKYDDPFEKKEPQLPPAWKIRGESLTNDQIVLNELLGGMGALFGAAKDKVVQTGQKIGGTYVKGEAQAILRKMAEIGKALQARGYRVKPEQAQEYARLKRAVGLA
jgi:hypothetical protein